MKLDDRARAAHSHLTASDQCWCLGGYVPGRSYRVSAANQLIANLKCAPSVAAAEPVRARHKRRAIEQAAVWVREAVAKVWAEEATWIPVPPSCAQGHVDYDDRLIRILRLAFASYDADVRGILYQVQTRAADHLSRRRLSMKILYDCIRVNSAALVCRPLRRRIVLFDDVLTTGKHYKCCEQRLLEALPGLHVSGFFLMRRVLSIRGLRVPGHLV